MRVFLQWALGIILFSQFSPPKLSIDGNFSSMDKCVIHGKKMDDFFIRGWIKTMDDTRGCSQ